MNGSREGLETPIGTEVAMSLPPARITIERVEIVEVGKDKKAKKVVLFCSHPNKADGVLELSNVKIIKGDKISVEGLWYNLDSKNEIRKGSVLADFMTFMKVNKLVELEHREVDTVLNEKYLVIRGYN